jgi:hypothetical protein
MPGAVAHTCNPSYSGDRDQEDYGTQDRGVGGAAHS